MNRTLERIIDKVVVTLHPKYWVRLGHTNVVWDVKLNRLLDQHKFVAIDNYYATLGGQTMWVTNHPYASFQVGAPGHHILPSRATVRRAHRHLVRDVIEPTTDELKG